MKYLFDQKVLNVRQRRWIEFLKDYEFGLNYVPEKANMVVNTLSHKSLYASWMMVKEVELAESFTDLNPGVTLVPYSLKLNWMRVTSDFKGQIAQAQMEEEDFLRTITLVKEGKLKG